MVCVPLDRSTCGFYGYPLRRVTFPEVRSGEDGGNVIMVVACSEK